MMKEKKLTTQTASTKLTKLITNQYIIGKTTQENNKTIIFDPYIVIPSHDGIQIFPYDEVIIGKKLEVMEINNDNIMYTTEVGTQLRNTYLQDISGIENTETDKQIIL